MPADKNNNLGGTLLKNLNILCDAICITSVICFIKMPFVAIAGLVVVIAIQKTLLTKTSDDLAACKIVASIYEKTIIKLSRRVKQH